MVKNNFSHVDAWVFDLDHTLYTPEMSLFDQIEKRMTCWIMKALSMSHQEADDLRQSYWREYGTTLAGLMNERGVNPDDYLPYVHDIDFSVLRPDEILRRYIEALPGRKIVFTNSTRAYAHNVLQALGLVGVFDGIYGVEQADFRPKPERRAYDNVFAQAALMPKRAAMFEDDPRNLEVPHELGLRTVHISSDITQAPHIHHRSNDLRGFLKQIVG